METTSTNQSQQIQKVQNSQLSKVKNYKIQRIKVKTRMLSSTSVHKSITRCEKVNFAAHARDMTQGEYGFPLSHK